jgi:hypothetical protein
MSFVHGRVALAVVADNSAPRFRSPPLKTRRCGQLGGCHHYAVINADRWPDEAVLLDLDRRAVCTKCGVIGADVRPNWSERPPPGSLTGAQWRQR